MIALNNYNYNANNYLQESHAQLFVQTLLSWK